MIRQIRAAKYCVVIATETYRRRVDGLEKPGTGLGATWESQAITQELYEQQGGNSKFLAAIFGQADAKHIPTYLSPYTYFDVSSEVGYEDLLRLVSQQHRHPRPPIGPLRKLPPAPISTDEATQDIERSVIAYSAEEADDTATMRNGFFYPWVLHAGHYELRVRPRAYKKERLDRMVLRTTLTQLRVGAESLGDSTMPFGGYDVYRNFLVDDSEGVEGTVADLEARAYEYVRLHRSGQFRLIRHMPDDFKNARFDESDRVVSAHDLIESISLMWLLAGRVAREELVEDEVADVLSSS
jgi:hypothetical protein